MSAEDKFASLFSLFEAPNKSDNSSLDISDIPNAQVYTKLVQTLTTGSEPSSNKKISLTLDSSRDCEDWLDFEESDIAFSSEQLPSFEQIQNVDVVNSSAQNWSPTSSKFKTLTEMMDNLMFREKEKNRNDEEIIKTEKEINELIASASSNLIFSNFNNDDEDYNKETEAIVGNLISKVTTSNRDDDYMHNNFLNKVSYSGTCSFCGSKVSLQ
jgi:hypothetical protein